MTFTRAESWFYFILGVAMMGFMLAAYGAQYG